MEINSFFLIKPPENIAKFTEEVYRYNKPKVLLKFNGNLYKKLGFTQKNAKLEAIFDRFKHPGDDPTFYWAKTSDEINPIYWRDNLNFMNVHCNIVKHSFLSNKLTKLLRTIPIDFNVIGKMCHLNFLKEMFIPIEKETIHSIEIELKTLNGKLYPLIFGSVIVILHFKKQII